ncbi:hypothetical protein LINPERHAP2_LOCUS28679 [Linum perenne]
MGRKKTADETGDGEGGRSYFPWNDELDQLLMKCILTIADDKKVDAKGKFANGAYVLLERLMLTEKPNCGVKAIPNIVSRCWDDVKKAVDIEDTSYAEYVENHSHCAKLNRVPFPCYDGLEKVFGKGRATGKGAVGPEDLEQVCPNIDVPNRLLLQWNAPRDGDNQPSPTEEQHHDNPENPTTEETPNPHTHSERATHSARTSARKRVRRSKNDDDDDIAELKPAIAETMASLKEMLGEAGDAKRQRSMLYTELEKIDGLSMDQVVDVSLQLGKDDGMLQVFFSLADHAKKRFIELRTYGKTSGNAVWRNTGTSKPAETGSTSGNGPELVQTKEGAPEGAVSMPAGQKSGTAIPGGLVLLQGSLLNW